VLGVDIPVYSGKRGSIKRVYALKGGKKKIVGAGGLSGLNVRGQKVLGIAEKRTLQGKEIT